MSPEPNSTCAKCGARFHEKRSYLKTLANICRSCRPERRKIDTALSVEEWMSDYPH